MKSISRACLILVVCALVSIVNGAMDNLSDAVYQQPNEDKYIRGISGKEILRQAEYDFIIIGGGTAGSVVANRLSENPKWKVLLLEAGRDGTVFNDIPALAILLELSDYNWKYSTQPQKHSCWAMKNKRCIWPRGKVLGGTSIINHMIYARGSKHDYDEWSSLGNTGWSYEEVLPYFLKSENMQIPKLKNSKYHSSKGLVHIEAQSFHTNTANAFLAAGRELGYGVTPDYNGEEELGFSHFHQTMKKGFRYGASSAFLRPIQGRSNLHISLGSRVSKIIIDPVSKRATGVEFVKDRLLFRINATKEVVLSAGALNSPQILMLSGIGPKDHLDELGIPLIQDLSVGKNLQNHIGFIGLTFLVNETIGLIPPQNPIGSTLRYIMNGTGPLAVGSGAEAFAFVRTKIAEDQRADIEFMYSSVSLSSVGSNPLVLQNVGITKDFLEDVYSSIFYKDVFTIVPILLRPKSRGVIKLRDKNPFHYPLFDPNNLSDKQDLKVLVEGIKLAIKVSETTALRKYGARLHNVSIPGCRQFKFGSDAYWGCACKYMVAGVHHQVGTCKMGPDTDPEAVVDPHLRVHHIHGLRVADASIMPREITGHTMAVAYMIGEKASDFIKMSWS